MCFVNWRLNIVHAAILRFGLYHKQVLMNHYRIVMFADTLCSLKADHTLSHLWCPSQTHTDISHVHLESKKQKVHVKIRNGIGHILATDASNLEMSFTCFENFIQNEFCHPDETTL